jgi:hypothetical protein
MARNPSGRHGKPTRKPVTLDIKAEPTASVDDTSKTEPENVPTAEPVAFEAGRSDTAAETVKKGAATAKPSVDEDARGAVERGSANTESGETESLTAQADRAQPAARSPKPGSAAQSGSGGGFSTITAGIIGAVVALLVAGGLQWAGFLGAPGRTAEDTAPMQAEIDALSAKIAEVEASSPDALPKALEARIEGAETSASAASASATELHTQLSAIGEQVTALQQAVASGEAGDGAGLAAVGERLTALEGNLSEVQSRLAEVASGDPAATEALSTEIASTKEGLTELRGAAEAVTGEIATISERISGVETAMGDLDERLSAAEADIDSGAGSRVASAIAASTLKSAADRGSAFMSELESYAAVAGSNETVESLRSYAAGGVPTVAQLNERFPAVANDIVAAASGLDPDASIGERLMSSARSMVQIRPVGEVEGDGPGEIAARMEVALESGVLERVVTEWETLPEGSRQASQGFIDDVTARRTLDSLITDVLSGAIQPAASAGQ